MLLLWCVGMAARIDGRRHAEIDPLTWRDLPPSVDPMIADPLIRFNNSRRIVPPRSPGD
jgi:hypothetical protein